MLYYFKLGQYQRVYRRRKPAKMREILLENLAGKKRGFSDTLVTGSPLSVWDRYEAVCLYRFPNHAIDFLIRTNKINRMRRYGRIT